MGICKVALGDGGVFMAKGLDVAVSRRRLGSKKITFLATYIEPPGSNCFPMDIRKRLQPLAEARSPMRFHKQVLSSPQYKLFERLGPYLSQQGFYLAGGTAVALMLGHRKSIDLDWFTPVTMGDPKLWINKIKSRGVKPTKLSSAEGTLHAMVDGVRISLLEYPYLMLHKVTVWKKLGATVASLDDLACMKLSAIAQRGSKKDFIDIYALMKKHKSLSAMLRLYQKKYAGHDIAPVLYGLAYFDDADKQRTPTMLWKVDWLSIKKEISNALKKARP